jgi:rfaE bifunctional protein kinase chain/domain/rfaE bifunctional protein nucleotidyltransferase chain/domain
MKKIVSKAELLKRAAEARDAGRTIVHCHGCFDIVHPGHVRYIEFARRQGDLLIVSLTGDSEVTKGVQRPYIPEELRAENLAALEAVDLVYVNPRPTAVELLAELQPDIYVKGREYEHNSDPAFLAEKQVVSDYGGRVLFSSGDIVFSSTRLIEALSREPGLDMERLSLVCRRHAIDRDSLDLLLARLAGLRVLVVGDVVIDRYVLCDATELASEAPMMSLTQLEERTYVGGAGIVAQHVAGMGAQALLLSTCATDAASDLAQETFEQKGIHADLIQCRPRMPRKTRYLVDTSKVMRVEDGEFHPLDTVAEEEAARRIESLVDHLDAVIFCDFGYGTITGGLLERLRPLFKERNLIVTADTSGPRGRLLDFRNADLLCPTERILRASLHDFEGGLSSVAWHVLEQTDARQLLVTLGKKGLVVFNRPSEDINCPEWRGRLRSEYLPMLADRQIDSLGCDSALQSTVSLALAAGGSIMQAAYLGMAAAAVEYAAFGNEPLDLRSLRRWLSLRLELTRSARRRPGEGVRFAASTSESPSAKRLPPAHPVSETSPVPFEA